MTASTDRSELAKVLAGVGKMLPDFFAVFEAESLALVHINAAGKKLIDPSGTKAMDKVKLPDIVGVNDCDRFRNEVYPQTRVLGSWSGVLVMRDFLGSEFTQEVKLLEIPALSGTGGRCLCLHASPSNKGSAGRDLVSDPDMLSALLETSHNSINFKDTAGRYLRISRTMAKKHGLADPREAIGKTDFDLYSAEHAARAFEEEQRIIKTGEAVIDCEEKVTFGDGTTAWMSTMKLPFHNREGKLIGTYALSRDITARKQAEEEMKKNEAMLQSIYSAAPIGIALVQGRNILKVNALLCEIADRTAEEIVGKSSLPLYLNEAEHARAGHELYDDLAVRRLTSTEATWRHKDGSLIDVQMTAAALDLGDRDEWRIVTVLDVTEKKRSEQKLRMLSRAVEQSPTSIIITDTRGKIEYANPYFEKITGYSLAEAVGQNPRILKSGSHSADFYKELWAEISAGHEWSGEFKNRRKNGENYWERATISALRSEQGRITHYIAVKEDITERKQAEVNRRELEARLQLSSKLESVGSLAAGVAHEINTPTQYIADNVRFLIDSFQQLSGAIAGYRAGAAAHPECAPARKDPAAAEAEKELDYLLGEVPRTLEQSLEGLGRISKIVGSLKEFSHPGGEGRGHADINRAVETTIAVSRHEWKYVADVVTELDPNLPPVDCVIDEINQAMLNLVINATHAIEDALKKRGEKRGCITIRTRREAEKVIIEVQDTGTGIPENIRGRIFEPFYTTKGVGKGTGQGLAIVQSVIVKKHQGSIEFTTEMGKGTTFKISLPLGPVTTAAPAAPLPTPAGAT